MRLLFKLAIILSVTFAFLAGVSALVLQSAFVSRFDKIEDFEEQAFKDNIETVARIIDSQISPLVGLALDYGRWDATYEFALGRNPAYVDEHVEDSTFPALGVDAAYIFDNQGRTVWSETLDPEFSEDIQAANLPTRVHKSDPTKLRIPAWQSSGILSTPRGLMIVGAASIHRNDDSGPAAGTIVLARMMDRDFLAGIKEQTNFQPKFVSEEDVAHCDEIDELVEPTTTNSSARICKKYASQLVGLKVVFDPLGNPVSILTIETARKFSEIGKSEFRLALILLGVVCLISIATVGFAVHRVVIVPIASLSSTIYSIDQSRRLSERSEIASQDEIGTLSRKLNSMLDSLGLAEAELSTARTAAEEANRAKSEFLTMMSHELRTPLNGVIGMSEVVKESGLSESQRAMVEIIESSGSNLLEILNNILDLSKLEAGHTELQLSSCDVEELVVSTVKTMGPSVQGNAIVVETKIDPDVPSSFKCDIGKLQQVLRNYVGNALKFTSAGIVAVHVSMKETKAEECDRIWFGVEDTGIGIEREVIKKLFNPFVQADSSTSRKFGGTGLGLAICKELAALMGGEVGCESVPGEGSTFWIALPALEAESDEVYLKAASG